MVHTMTTKQPCQQCVETIADLRQAVSDAIHNAYVSGAVDVHNNYQEDSEPSFGEAAADYVASLDVNAMLAHFLPKSPAQQLAEKCPHGMTEEAAQWVLDHFAETCAVCGIANKNHFTHLAPFGSDYHEFAATPTDPALPKPACAECLHFRSTKGDYGHCAARRTIVAKWERCDCFCAKEEQTPTDTAPRDRNLIRKINEQLGNCEATDPAPRYVFGPLDVLVKQTQLQDGAEYRVGKHGKVFTYPDLKPSPGMFVGRAYRIGVNYPHGGGECPLADGSVRVRFYIDGNMLEGCADIYHWPDVTSFTPLVEGKST